MISGSALSAEVAVLDALDVPRTTGEVYVELQHRRWQAWADEQGVEMELDERGLMQPGIHRLLAWSWAQGRGYPVLDHPRVYARLCKLEREGAVTRLTMPSHTRSILWLRTSSGGVRD